VLPQPNQADRIMTPPPTAQWKMVVIYQPDGRATESEIRLREEVTENKLRLRIRGFTGGVSIDGLERKPPANPQQLDAQQPDGTPTVETSRTPQSQQELRGVNAAAIPPASSTSR
jgi:hypothetical protein